MFKTQKIGFGGGCHWCTEAVYQSLKGVIKVDQGFIASKTEPNKYSEAVIVYFNNDEIPLAVLVQIHLRTHNSTVNHKMREKYRSAIYLFSKERYKEIADEMAIYELEVQKSLVTEIVEFNDFKESKDEFKNYYQSNPEKPFCKTYINPKLSLLLRHYANYYQS